MFVNEYVIFNEITKSDVILAKHLFILLNTHDHMVAIFFFDFEFSFIDVALRLIHKYLNPKNMNSS